MIETKEIVENLMGIRLLLIITNAVLGAILGTLWAKK